MIYRWYTTLVFQITRKYVQVNMSEMMRGLAPAQSLINILNVELRKRHNTARSKRIKLEFIEQIG